MSKNEPIYQQQIIKQLADEYGLHKEQVRRAVMHQFRFVRKIMTKGEHESVRLRYFGKFDVDEKRKRKLDNKYGKDSSSGSESE